MGKARRERLRFNQNGSSPPAKDEKISLTHKQLKNLIIRVRINQMEQDEIQRKQIKKRLKCTDTLITKWKNVGFDDPKAFFDGIRTGRPEVSRKIEKVVLRKRHNKKFSLRKAGLQLNISYKTVQHILHDAELKWKVRPRATKLTDYHKKARLNFCKTYKDQDLLWWNKLLITDSQVFLLGGGRNPKHHGRWVYDSEELDSWEVGKHSKGLHVYGGMTSKGLTQLVFINGNIDGERYVNEVLPTLTDVRERIEETDDITTTVLFYDNEDWIFEQDHAKCHDADVALEYLIENVPNFFDKHETP
ncbi:unnamed protein product, partial [Rotaria sp. Silwood2]